MGSLFRPRGPAAPAVSPVYWPAVLLACVYEPLGEEIKLVLVVLGLFVTAVHRRGDLELRLPKRSGFLIAIVIFGLVAGLVNGQIEEFGAYKFFRDLAYYVSPFLLWILGCGMGKAVANEERFWTTLFAMSVAAAVSTLVAGVMKNGLYLNLGTFKANELMIYALVLLVADPEGWGWKEKHTKLAWALGAFDAIVLLLTLSRTTIVCLALVVLLLALRSFSRFFRALAIGLVCCGCAVILLASMPSSTSNQFLDKFSNSLTEVSSSRVVWTDVEVTQNWRGYEKYCATNNFENAGSFTKLFGNGFGYQLPMGGYAYLVVQDPSGGIPFLHNGYYSVLFKCGALGLVALFLFYGLHFWELFRLWLRGGKFIDGLSLGMLAGLIFCTYVIEGLFIPSGMYYFTLPLAMAFGLKLCKSESEEPTGLNAGR